MTSETQRLSTRVGRLFIVSAPSGAGKSTLCRLALERLPNLRYSVSTTTRPPRKGEIEGRDYFFTDSERFKAGIAAHQWAEWAEVHGHYYGTSASFIDAQRAAGNDLLLDIDVQGAAQLRAMYPDAVSIFIMPPSMADLRLRLDHRGADAPEVIAKRLANARREMDQRDAYQFIIVNDRLEEALADLLRILSRPAAGDGSAGQH